MGTVLRTLTGWYRGSAAPQGTTGQQIRVSTEQEVGVGGAREDYLKEGAPSRAWKIDEDSHSFPNLPGLRTMPCG